MAADRIKGITIEIGGDTTALSAALGDVNKKLNSTQTNLRDVERLLKFDPKNTELLAQKQRLLSEKISDTKEKLDTLKNAEKQVQQQFEKGDISQRQYDSLKREIIDVTNALKTAEDAAKETSKALSGIGRIGMGAETLAKSAGSVSSTMKPVTSAIAGIATAAVATIPATEELREDLSKLDQNARESGVGAEAAREAWKKFAVQSGETDSAVEATSNLLQAGFKESNLQKAVEGLAGAAQRFPDTLKVESLADSLQETLATGEATGQFSELLSRLGLNVEAFNEDLAACTTETERQNLALQTMAEAGLNDTYNAWVKNNEEMLANKEANLSWQESMAKLAEEILPFVTEIINLASGLVNWFVSLDDETKRIIVTFAALVAAVSPIAGAISKVSSAISFIIQNPIVLLIAAIVALVALIATKGDEIQAVLQKVDDFLQNVFAKDWTEVFGPGLGDVLNGFFASLKGIWDGVKLILDGIIDFIRGVFTGDWKRAWEGVKKIFSGIVNTLEAVFKSPLNGIISLINGMIGGVNLLIDGLNKIPGVDISPIGKIPYLAKGGVLSQGSAVVGDAGPEILTVEGGRAIVQPLTHNTTTQNHYMGGVTLNVYAAPGQDVEDLADAVADRLEDMAERKEAVFA